LITIKPPERAAFFVWVDDHLIFVLEDVMKRFFAILLFAACLALPVRVHASAAIEAASTTLLTSINNTLFGQFLMDEAFQFQQALDDAASVYQSYEQLQHWIRNEERYMKNLLSVVDARSFGDFMSWFNRKSYIARESERIYSGMGVKVGGKFYSLSDMDEIPDALRSEYVDRHWGDMSEDERYRVWTSLGLAPSNYFYLKTWEKRNEEIKKRFVAAREMHLDELEDAAARNSAVLGSYSAPNEDIDSNKIAKNSHATQMQIEMVLRDLSMSLDDFKDYIVSRDEANKVLPNAMVPSESWNSNYFKPIAGGRAQNNYSD